MKHIKKENGAVMVEATIYMPLVLCTVMALLYLALFNMQEYMMMYQVQRVVAVAAREEAYLGYDVFDMGADNEIDFDWGDGIPSSKDIQNYYEAYSKDATAIYREMKTILDITGITEENGENYSIKFADAARQSTLIALGTISTPEVEIDTGFWGTEVEVTITHSIPVPGVLAYLGFDNYSPAIRTVAYSYSVNPSEFVRNVDLATDLVDYIKEKLGLSESYDAFLEKTNEVLSYIIS